MYSIKKTYHGHESKNRIDSKNLTLQQAKDELDTNERLWKKNSGVIIEKTEDTLTVEEDNGEGRITYSIEEIND